MRKLFIIGNGFDCYGHNMNTRYVDFRRFLVSKYPEYCKDFDGIPEITIRSDGEEKYNMNEVVGLMLSTIDNCSSEDWNNLEECLGNKFIENIAYGNEWAYKITDIEDDNIFHSVYENEDLTYSITRVYCMLNKLFTEWVFEELANIDFTAVEKLSKKPFFKEDLFLTFNYTQTLEKLYNISPDNICHIHGNSNDISSHIYFGHGDDTEFDAFENYIGVEDAYNGLKREFRKKTNKAIAENMEFFSKIENVKEIYSYGFSFSEVDMVYLKKISRIIDVKKVGWYFNQYDWINNQENVEKVKKLGFRVRVCRRW